VAAHSTSSTGFKQGMQERPSKLITQAHLLLHAHVKGSKRDLQRATVASWRHHKVGCDGQAEGLAAAVELLRHQRACRQHEGRVEVHAARDA
jgi:hypothetical protein